jgi:CHAT domain-containing protein
LYLSQPDPDGMGRTVARLQDLLSQVPVSPDPAVPLGEPTAQPDALDAAEAEEQIMDLQRQHAAAIAMMVQNVTRQAYVLIPDYRGLRAREAGDEERARQEFEEALARATQTRTQDTVLAEISALAHLGRWEEATVLYRQYINTQMQSIARGLESSPVGPANSMFLPLKQQCHMLAFIAFTKLKAYQEALSHVNSLERLLGEDWWQHQEQPWQPLTCYAEAHEGLGRWDRAQAYYDQAIALLEDRRGRLTGDELKTALAAVEDVQRMYFQAARTAAKRYQAALAVGDPAATEHVGKVLEYAERGKARALLDLVAADIVLAGSTPTEIEALRIWRKTTTQLTLWHGLLAQERSKTGLEQPDQQRIEELNDKIIATEAKLRPAEAELAQAAPNFYSIANPRAAVISLDELIARLPPGTALLQYYFLGEDLLSWAITYKGASRLHRAELDTRALARQIRDFYCACENTGAAVDEPGLALVQTLLTPFASEIRDHAHLIVVPYGAAHTLPFHALPWEGQPLAATHTVSYLPSSSALQYLRREQAGRLPDRILAVGNPAGMAYRPPLGDEAIEQNPLPATEVEAAAVAGLFGDSLLLLSEKATESTVREHISDYPLLHFATHGYMSEDAPLLSSILLANGGGLTVYELMGLRLNANLVVLSACETARGKTTGGDDVIGLARGLLAAGARAAVVSLWPVDDLSTSLFMGHFYSRLRVGDTPAVALQAAQRYLRELTPERAAEEFQVLKVAIRGSGVEEQARHLIAEAQATPRHVGARQEWAKSPTRDYRHPYYWAPFILVG